MDKAVTEQSATPDLRGETNFTGPIQPVQRLWSRSRWRSQFRSLLLLPAADSQARALENLQDLQRRWLQILFSLMLVGLTIIWLNEALVRHEVAPIDQVAYPIVLSSASISLIVLKIKPQAYNWAVLGTVGATVLYTVTFLQAIIWGYIPLSDQYNLVTFAQWFPLTYIILFLFIEKNRALLCSMSVYLSLVIPSLIHGWSERRLPIDQQRFPYLLHMIISHPIYIAVFVAVATLQQSFLQAQAQAVQAEIDDLTQLANRRAANRAIRDALAQDALGPVGVMLIDIDHFKTINDTFGHPTGDRVLVQVAQIFQQTLPESILVARWGGEEFIAIATATNSEEVHRLAEELRQQLVNYPHRDVGRVSASFGVAVSEPQESLHQLMKRADEALYNAKRQGRNRVVLAQPC